MKKKQGKLFKSRKVILEMRNREAADQHAFILFSPSQAVRQSTDSLADERQETVTSVLGVKASGRLPPLKRRFKHRLPEDLRQIARSERKFSQPTPTTPFQPCIYK